MDEGLAHDAVLHSLCVIRALLTTWVHNDDGSKACAIRKRIMYVKE